MKDSYTFTPPPMPDFPNPMKELREMHQQTLKRLDTLIALQTKLLEATLEAKQAKEQG